MADRWVGRASVHGRPAMGAGFLGTHPARGAAANAGACRPQEAACRATVLTLVSDVSESLRAAGAGAGGGDHRAHAGLPGGLPWTFTHNRVRKRGRLRAGRSRSVSSEVGRSAVTLPGPPDCGLPAGAPSSPGALAVPAAANLAEDRPGVRVPGFASGRPTWPGGPTCARRRSIRGPGSHELTSRFPRSASTATTAPVEHTQQSLHQPEPRSTSSRQRLPLPNCSQVAPEEPDAGRRRRAKRQSCRFRQEPALPGLSRGRRLRWVAGSHRPRPAGGAAEPGGSRCGRQPSWPTFATRPGSRAPRGCAGRQRARFFCFGELS